MGKIGEWAGNLFLWKFERGTTAYDVMVVLILLFVFLVPESCFKKPSGTQPPASKPQAAETATGK